MKFTATRKWAAGVVAASALVLSTAQITLAAQAAHPQSAAAAAAAQVDYPREGQPNLYTYDVPRLSAFYQRLGFVELFQFPLPDGTVAFATLQKGPFYLTLANTTVIRQSTGIRQIGPSYFKPNDITVLVPDVDASFNTVRSSGARVLMEPREQPWGERQAYVTDPDGNLVQISTHRGGH